MIIALTDLVTYFSNLSECQQTLSTVRVFHNLDHAVVWTCLDSETCIDNIVYLEIPLNWPKKDHLQIRATPQVRGTRTRQRWWGGEDRHEALLVSLILEHTFSAV